MHNPASGQKNNTQKFFWDFKILMDHLILTRRPDLIIINKKEDFQNCELCSAGWQQNKVERKQKRDKQLDLAREWIKIVEHESDGKPIGIGALGTVTNGLVNGLEV